MYDEAAEHLRPAQHAPHRNLVCQKVIEYFGRYRRLDSCNLSSLFVDMYLREGYWVSGSRKTQK